MRNFLGKMFDWLIGDFEDAAIAVIFLSITVVFCAYMVLA